VTVPLVTVSGPTPTPYGYGLYSVAAPSDSADPRTQKGVQWPLSGCGVAQPFAIDCPPTQSLPALVTKTGLPWVNAYPFGVVAGVKCKPVGTPVDELQAEARQILRLSEQWAVERAYWKGGVWPASVLDEAYLASAGATILNGGTAVSARAAVGILEDALGGMSGGVGVIHLPALAAGLLDDLGVRQQGGRLMTKLDTPVACGRGYDGTSPANARPAGTAYFYATGPVQVTRGPVIDLPSNADVAVDRSTNEASVWAARIVSVAHSCGVVGVNVTLA
jgi:hypothetical protein